MNIANYYKNKDLYKNIKDKMSEKEIVNMFEDGISSAETVETIIEYGNTFYIRDMTDYVNDEGDIKEWQPKTTKDIIKILEKYKDRHLTVGFAERDIILPYKEIEVNKKSKLYHWIARFIKLDNV